MKWLPWVAGGAVGLLVLSTARRSTAAPNKPALPGPAPAPNPTGLELDFLLPATGRTSFVHTFTKGETIPMVAEMYYGSAEYWPLVSAANFAKVLGDPNWSVPKTDLTIWRNESISAAEFAAAATYARKSNVAV